MDNKINACGNWLSVVAAKLRSLLQTMHVLIFLVGSSWYRSKNREPDRAPYSWNNYFYSRGSSFGSYKACQECLYNCPAVAVVNFCITNVPIPAKFSDETTATEEAV